MKGDTSDREHWAQFAKEWIAWAGLPGHDAFWSFRNAFIAYIGNGPGAALEVGCGEGRVSRELKALGYTVTATDAVAEMVDAARLADSADHYANAPASKLAICRRQL